MFDAEDCGTKAGDSHALRMGARRLHEAGAIRQCDEHGWMRDRADPHAREHAVDIARQYPPTDISPEQAVAEIRDVLDSIGDTCPECPPD